jgi:HAMP domain-containing protein
VVLGWLGLSRPGLFVAMAVVLGAAGVFVWFIVGQQQSALHLSASQLTLKAPLYGRTLPIGDVLVEQIESVTLNRQSPYGLTWRLNGLSVPGYDLGWFQTRSKGKVLAALTRDQALAIPTRRGYILLVSVQDPDGLSSQLRELNHFSG